MSNHMSNMDPSDIVDQAKDFAASAANVYFEDADDIARAQAMAVTSIALSLCCAGRGRNATPV